LAGSSQPDSGIRSTGAPVQPPGTIRAARPAPPNARPSALPHATGPRLPPISPSAVDEPGPVHDRRGTPPSRRWSASTNPPGPAGRRGEHTIDVAQVRGRLTDRQLESGLRTPLRRGGGSGRVRVADRYCRASQSNTIASNRRASGARHRWRRARRVRRCGMSTSWRARHPAARAKARTQCWLRSGGTSRLTLEPPTRIPRTSTAPSQSEAAAGRPSDGRAARARRYRDRLEQHERRGCRPRLRDNATG